MIACSADAPMLCILRASPFAVGCLRTAVCGRRWRDRFSRTCSRRTCCSRPSIGWTGFLWIAPALHPRTGLYQDAPNVAECGTQFAASRSVVLRSANLSRHAIFAERRGLGMTAADAGRGGSVSLLGLCLGVETSCAQTNDQERTFRWHRNMQIEDQTLAAHWPARFRDRICRARWREAMA